MPKAGYVYVGESKRANGQKQIYTGSTHRTPYERWGEHIRSVKNPNAKSWVSKGTHFKPIGAVWSQNPRKAEQTIKKMSSEQKRAFGQRAAAKYNAKRR